MILLAEDIQKIRKAKIFMLYVTMASITMAFAAFTSAFIVRRSQGNWLMFEISNYFSLSTISIILSSISLFIGIKNAKKGRFEITQWYFLASLILGICFMFSQYFAWKEMTENGLYLVGTNVSTSFFYIITGTHFAHIISGLICLLVSWVKLLRNKYLLGNQLGLTLSANYWHFLDILWLYLIGFLYLMNN